jgi:hypothetical protein
MCCCRGTLYQGLKFILCYHLYRLALLCTTNLYIGITKICVGYVTSKRSCKVEVNWDLGISKSPEKLVCFHTFLFDAKITIIAGTCSLLYFMIMKDR